MNFVRGTNAAAIIRRALLVGIAVVASAVFFACELIPGDEVDPDAEDYVELVGSIGDTVVTVEFNRPDTDADFTSVVQFIDADLDRTEDTVTGTYSNADSSFEITVDDVSLKLSDEDSAAEDYDVVIIGEVIADGSVIGQIQATDGSSNVHTGAIAGGDSSSEGATIRYAGDVVNQGTFTAVTYEYDGSDTVTGGPYSSTGTYDLDGTFTLSITDDQFTLTIESSGTGSSDDWDPTTQDMVVLQRIYGTIETGTGAYEVTQMEQYDSANEEWYEPSGFDALDIDISNGTVSLSESSFDGGSFDITDIESVDSYRITTISVTASTFTLDGEEVTVE